MREQKTYGVQSDMLYLANRLTDSTPIVSLQSQVDSPGVLHQSPDYFHLTVFRFGMADNLMNKISTKWNRQLSRNEFDDNLACLLETVSEIDWGKVRAVGEGLDIFGDKQIPKL